MGRPVVLALRAQRDLEEIVRYIARDNPAAAEKCGRGLHDQAQLLGESPELGSKVRSCEHVRALLRGAYYIVYRYPPGAQRIEVLRFWHSARDLTRVRFR
jgi:toxin ParE1/3/4